MDAPEAKLVFTRALLALASAATLALAACAPQAAAPTAVPAKPAPTTAPAKAEAPAPKPAATTAPAAKPAAPSKPLPRTMSIGTNQAGTGAHAIASALGKVASTHTPITVKVVPATGPNVWMPQLDQGEVELGIMNVLDASLAYAGKGEYTKPYPKLRLVTGGVFPFTGSMLAKKDSDLKTIADLKGKRIASDFGGHAITVTMQNAILASAGLTMADVQAVPVPSVPASTRALIEGRVDSTWSAVGIGSTEEANASIGVRFLPVGNTPEGKAAVERTAPGVTVVIQKGGSATAVLEDIPVLGYPLHLVGSADVPAEAVYAVLKVWWEKEEELRPIHPLMQQWTHENQVFKQFTIPYHPGTVQFFQELKLWTPEMDARQKKFLGQ
ncbi:MAG: TAXI family TRAP transporter solute-binding subunit [Chloroflexi bacterium]|nr:TAXI family TRAP transporter solute-binding subunit [Chloroflexota bacterium]